MKPLPKLRNAAKWTATVVTLLLFLAWIGTKFWWIAWRGQGGMWFDIWEGALSGGDTGYAFRSRYIGLDVGLMGPEPFRWWPAWKLWSTGWQFALPLWIPTVVVMVVAIIAWRLDFMASSRARSGNCSKCNYSLSGLTPNTPCPECGAPPAAP